MFAHDGGQEATARRRPIGASSKVSVLPTWDERKPAVRGFMDIEGSVEAPRVTVTLTPGRSGCLQSMLKVICSFCEPYLGTKNVP